MAEKVLWAIAAGALWGAWRGDASAVLTVREGGNASCPWVLSLSPADERRRGQPLEVCTHALPVGFEGSSPAENLTDYVYNVSSRTAPLPPTPSSPALQDESCEAPAGYTRLPTGGVYKLHEEKATWLEARATCESEGAHLVVLNSTHEATALKAYLETKRHLWSERPFTLHAGFHVEFSTTSGRALSSLGYEVWAWQEPSAPLCGRIDHDVWLLFGSCAHRQRFVCQLRNASARASAPNAFPTLAANANATVAATSADTATRNLRASIFAQMLASLRSPRNPYKWKRLNVFNFHGDTWKDAIRACREDHAQLAVIETVDDAENIIRVLQDLPEDEPSGDTLVGLRTREPITVLGDPLSSSGYNRWVKKGYPESCLCIDIKVMLRTCSCENASMAFLCMKKKMINPSATDSY